jgi:DNA-binding Lrp family transcriptional regulator
MRCLVGDRRGVAHTGDVAEGIDEVDLALLDGVHVNPRVGFGELGQVLGLSGATVARRWSRLVEEGHAWVSSAIGPALPVTGALLEAECAPGMAQQVADRWASVAQVFSVHLTTGRYNAYALIVAADDAMLARLLIDVLPATPGIRAIRSSTMFRLFSGTYWRLGAISPRQAREVAPGPVHASPHRFDDVDRRIYLALQHDGRLTYREVAARMECSETFARRRLQLLTRSGLISFRADFARADAGWPINVMMMLSLADGAAVDDIGRLLVGWPEVRVCAAVIGGAAQLFVTVQVHELNALSGLTARLHHTVAGITVLTQRVVLRPVKSFGRLLDVDGRARGNVPVDPWAALPAAEK